MCTYVLQECSLLHTELQGETQMAILVRSPGQTSDQIPNYPVVLTHSSGFLKKYVQVL